MRIMGLDVGTKTIGVAISDPLGLTAQGITTIKRRNKKADLTALKNYVEQYEVEQVVIGLPRNMNGTMGPTADMVQNFSALIKDELGLPIHFYDERLTTVAANKLLLEGDLSRKRRKKVIDQVAATYILQGFLDRNR
ncbi:MAG: putative pre6S rRNA nuclease [Clostridia bacterium]|nr:putative pre6S rRNA nuclease [Clostridia bacterium]